MDGLQALTASSDEVFITSAQASANPMFPSVGLTDAALLEAVSAERPLITADTQLYSLATAKAQNAAWDFPNERATDRNRRPQ